MVYVCENLVNIVTIFQFCLLRKTCSILEAWRFFLIIQLEDSCQIPDIQQISTKLPNTDVLSGHHTTGYN